MVLFSSDQVAVAVSVGVAAAYVTVTALSLKAISIVIGRVGDIRLDSCPCLYYAAVPFVFLLSVRGLFGDALLHLVWFERSARGDLFSVSL
jgi:hypothetical protein